MNYGFDVINAAKMYYDKINKEGGVNGRKIELVVEDDRCNANDLPGRGQEAHRAGPGVPAQRRFLLGRGGRRARIRRAREDPAGDAQRLGRRRACIRLPSYTYGAFSISQHAVGGSMVQFASEHLKAKKIGYINHDDAYGGCNLESAQAQAKALGGVDLQVQSVRPNITDVTAPMLKIKAANPRRAAVDHLRAAPP